MTKSEFLEIFANDSTAVHIRMALNYDAFLQNETITITEEAAPLSEVLNFYVPKYEKHGEFDRSHYNQQALDPEVLPLTIKQVISNPAKWDLALDETERPNIDQLSRLPVATDLKSNKTLLLDSNHTIVSALSELNPALFDTTRLSLVRVTGTGLEVFIPDFRILNRGT